MNLIKNNILILLYFITSFCYIYNKVNLDISKMLIFKTVMLFFLILNYFMSVKKANVFYGLILLVELIGGFLFTLSNDNIVIGIGFFFVVNLLLTILITKRIGLIRNRDVIIMFFIAAFIIVPSTYFTFKTIGNLKLFILLFAIVFSLLVSFSYINYKKLPNSFGKWFLIGVTFFIFRYMVGGYVHLVNNNTGLFIIEGASYVLGVYCLSKSMIIDANQYLEETKSFVQSRS